jgi:toxin ParE1/3/4
VLPVVRTAQAEEDLIAIWQWIASDDPGAADRTLDAFERRWQQLAGFPHSGIARDDIAPGIRHLTTGQYLTLYRVDSDCVRIIRVLHGRRHLPLELE